MCNVFHKSFSDLVLKKWVTDPDYIDWDMWTQCSADRGGGTRSRTGLGNDGVQRSETINCGMQSCDPLDPCKSLTSYHPIDPYNTIQHIWHTDAVQEYFHVLQMWSVARRI